MKRLLPALLLSAAAHTFAADTLRAIPAQAPAGFPFAVETQILSENTYQVKITDRKTGKAQIIEDIVIFPGYIQGNTGSPVDIRDYNGDGHPDIAVRVIGGYTLPADDLYLFNPATRQFEPVPEGKDFAHTGSVEIIRKGCVRIDYKNSARDYSQDDYCWKNGGWQLQRPNNAKAHKAAKARHK
ncbi:XAC2610-related protein [Neisseria bacilliformis]|jgi:hypothetical protein|uniref:FG-GAP repeat protein n=1 Tax=Neisseria bacilliformis ATCC BAA-1200 TaxID=888742 RepID=F2BFF5_9NEIS|nr:hypothetical protein [Neisseria bacilliformis]EGF08645.1 hypothetical protein HMPREF9123_2462 [Neisseria bacilliformis ATCC BAA-1200]QMT47059.1 hypothetical protein H3L91_09025 [Neisseria bacilliformis]